MAEIIGCARPARVAEQGVSKPLSSRTAAARWGLCGTKSRLEGVGYQGQLLVTVGVSIAFWGSGLGL